MSRQPLNNNHRVLSGGFLYLSVMSESIVSFFGSKEDIESFRDALKESSIQETIDTALNAAATIGDAGITVAVVAGLANCLKAWLTRHGAKCLTRTENKIEFRGDWKLEEIQKMVETHTFLDIRRPRHLPQSRRNNP